ncbi:hypothetical protein EAS64_35160 [Trebonia kvetii]|uniref:Uncharacterized protein n=2 Tax=Trebonia kvetii TaxID=2480626 RepID=A0A6P2BQB8_9ACTN|nr:hypothetical protein EAS64_35160 [Trebonia kvetii]
MIRLCMVVGLAAALAPVTLVACLAFWYAWWRGWPPRRVFAAAAWCLPMVLAWLGAIAAWPAGARAAHGAGAGAWWFRLVAAPYRAWAAMWQLLAHGHPVAAAVAVAAPAVPLGIVAGGACWAYRRFRMRTGAGGLTPESPAAFDARQWRHQVRTAQALIAAPGSLPLLSRSGHVVVGAAIRSLRHRAGRSAAIPYERLRAHQVVIGSTGTGKTTLLLRLWAGFMAAGLRRYAAGSGRRPLLVVLDCKGGASSRKVADRTRRVLRDAGARSTAIWPDEATLSLWALPPDRLVTTLLDLIEHGTGGAAFYTDVMEALVELAVYAPCGPPVSSADFLTRLDADWLAVGYAMSGDAEAVSVIRSGKRALEDVRLRFRALWRRLGAGLDSTGLGAGGSFADADAWYCVLEGTAEVAVAEAQARALTDLLAFHALRGDREILLCVDEFSAVARRLPIWRLYERARSLGLAVQVSAQSWEGLAGSDDERWRVAATAEGGIWLLRTPRPSPVAELAGNRPSVDTSRRMAGAGPWDDEGLSHAGTAPVLDGDLVRRLEVGQVCYVYRNGVTFLQIKRLTGRQAAIGRGAAAGGAGGADRVPGSAAAAAGAAFPDGPDGPDGLRGLGGLGGEAPTEPLHAVAGSVSRTVPVAGGRGRPGAPPPGPPLPDVSEVLDEAFGARRG